MNDLVDTRAVGTPQMRPWPASSRLGPQDVVLNANILLWAQPFLEGSLWINKRYRNWGDQDEALLCLAAWHFLMSDIAENKDLVATIGGMPVRTSLRLLQPERFRSSSLSALSEATGIPRVTAQRKLASLSRRGMFIEHDDATYRLRTLGEEILDLTTPAYALARWMLEFHGWPARSLGDPKSVRSFGFLVRHYLAAYISLLRSRRLHTGGISHVSVQLSLMLLQLIKVGRLIALDGPPANRGFETYVSCSIRLLNEPYYLQQVAYISGLSLSAVQRSVKRLSETNKLVTRRDKDSLTIGGLSLPPDEIGNRRFYTQDLEQHLTNFTKRVLKRAQMRLEA